MPLKAGVVQFSPSYGRVVDNLVRLERLVDEGVSRGAELLVLPEMAWTGYLWRDPASVRPFAEPAGSGPGQDCLARWARTKGVWLVFGFPEVDRGTFYNSQGLAAPDGIARPVYRKTHLFEADHWWATPGNSGFLQWATPWGAVGSGICMDLNYPDLVEFHVARQTAILAFSTNWLDQEFDIVPYWEDHLAGPGGTGFGGLALFADRGGQEFGIEFRGQSSIFWEGRCVMSLAGKEDGVLVTEVPKGSIPGR